MNSMSTQLSDLKFALQELESAVQQPRDERFSIEHILECFPAVLIKFSSVIAEALQSQGIPASSSFEMFSEAHARGWLRGELSLWLRLSSDYQQLKEESAHGARARAVAQDVRACSAMMWETYELLIARFRWQTQVQPAAHVAGRFVSQAG